MKLRWAETLISGYVKDVEESDTDYTRLADLNMRLNVLNTRDANEGFKCGLISGLKWALSVLNESKLFYTEEYYRMYGTYPKGVRA